jgi:hypothetical protein
VVGVTSDGTLIHEYAVSGECSIPNVLHACHQSRIEALRYYTPALAVRLGHPVYIDFRHDILIMDPMEDDQFVDDGMGAFRTFNAFINCTQAKNEQGDSELSDLYRRLARLAIGGRMLHIPALQDIQLFDNLEVLMLPYVPYWGPITVDDEDARRNLCSTIENRLKQEWKNMADNRNLNGENRSFSKATSRTWWEWNAYYTTPVEDAASTAKPMTKPWPTSVIFLDGENMEGGLKYGS